MKKVLGSHGIWRGEKSMNLVGSTCLSLHPGIVSATYCWVEYSWDGLASSPVGSRHSPRYFLPWKIVKLRPCRLPWLVCTFSILEKRWIVLFPKKRLLFTWFLFFSQVYDVKHYNREDTCNERCCILYNTVLCCKTHGILCYILFNSSLQCQKWQHVMLMLTSILSKICPSLYTSVQFWGLWLITIWYWTGNCGDSLANVWYRLTLL